MTKEQFYTATNIREEIKHLESKKLDLEKMGKRDNDEDFNKCRQIAHDGLCHVISMLEKDFTNIK